MHNAFSVFCFDEAVHYRCPLDSNSKDDFSVAYLKNINDSKNARQRSRHRRQKMNKGE